MARPREFDEDTVLEAATQRFWINRYEATSMRDLADSTGVTTASLYNAFGDKRAICRLVLDRYVRRALESCSAIFGGDDRPLRALERYFDALIEEALADALQKGCFVVNTALEVVPHDADFRDLVTNVFDQIEKYLRDCIASGHGPDEELEGAANGWRPSTALHALGQETAAAIDGPSTGSCRSPRLAVASSK